MNFQKIGDNYFNMNEVLSISPSYFGRCNVYVKGRDAPINVFCTEKQLEDTFLVSENKSTKPSVEHTVEQTVICSGKGGLLAACKNGNYEEVQRLLKDVPHLNVQAEEHEACVKYAADTGNTKLMRILRRFGADVHVDDFYAAFTAEKKQFTELLIYLVSDCDIPQKKLNALLQLAASSGRFENVETLVGCGADVTANNGLAYALARSNGHKNVTEFLALRGGISMQ